MWSSKGWSKGERDNFILSLIPVSGFHPISGCLIPTITMDGANGGSSSLPTLRVFLEVREQLFLFILYIYYYLRDNYGWSKWWEF